MSLNECYWIRCNRCTSALSQIQLYFTKCGHIFCRSHLKIDVKQDQADCPTSNSNTRLLEINSKLGHNKSIYFTDPEEEYKEAKKKINKFRSFQRYYFENNMKNLSVKFLRATEATKLRIR